MVISTLRVGCLVMLLAMVGLAAWRQSLATQVTQLEARWSQKVTAPSADRARLLRQELLAQGATITSAGGQLSQVQFQGSSDRAVALVNRLANAPYAWQSWSGQKLSRGQMKNVILVEKL